MRAIRFAGSLVSALILGLALAGCDAPNEQEETDTVETEAANDGPVAVSAPEDVAGPPEDAERSESGLAWKVLQAGDGATPSEADQVRVHYTGWTTDGERFDSSVERGQPAEFPAGALIEGWVETLTMMQAGEVRRVWIPGELAYDDMDRPDAPQGMLVFELKLIEVLGD